MKCLELRQNHKDVDILIHRSRIYALEKVAMKKTWVLFVTTSLALSVFVSCGPVQRQGVYPLPDTPTPRMAPPRVTPSPLVQDTPTTLLTRPPDPRTRPPPRGTPVTPVGTQRPAVPPPSPTPVVTPLPTATHTPIPTAVYRPFAHLTTVTDGQTRYHWARWSPRGDKIALAGSKSIDIISPTGASLLTINTYRSVDQDFQWSSDGNSLFFLDLRQPGPGRDFLFEIDLHAQTRREIPLPAYSVRARPPVSSKIDTMAISLDKDFLIFDRTGKVLYHFKDWDVTHYALSPDGTRVAYLSSTFSGPGFGPWVMEIATQNKTSLYREEGPVVVRAWSWSPDGRHLLLQRPPESLVIVSPNGNTRIDLGIGEFPAWSFDGSKIAYTYLEQDSEKFLAGDIYMVNVDGIEKTRLTHMAQQIAFKPVWSPNGKQIIFLAEKTRFVYIGTLP